MQSIWYLNSYSCFRLHSEQFLHPHLTEDCLGSLLTTTPTIDGSFTPSWGYPNLLSHPQSHGAQHFMKPASVQLLLCHCQSQKQEMEECQYGQARPAFFGRDRGGKKERGKSNGKKKLSPSPHSPKRAYMDERKIRKTLAFERKVTESNNQGTKWNKKKPNDAEEKKERKKLVCSGRWK